MLPASSLTEIITGLAALQLAPDTTAAILAAVFAPLLRNSEADPDLVPEDPKRIRKRRAGRPRAKSRSALRRKKSKRRAPRSTVARERARAALQANPDASLTAVAELAGVSRGTVVNPRAELAKEVRKEARKAARRSCETSTAKPTVERAQRFLRERLARGPQRVSDVEEAAAKARVDPDSLTQARADLGIVTSRANTGGVHAVQWSLPG